MNLYERKIDYIDKQSDHVVFNWEFRLLVNAKGSVYFSYDLADSIGNSYTVNKWYKPDYSQKPSDCIHDLNLSSKANLNVRKWLDSYVYVQNFPAASFYYFWNLTKVEKANMELMLINEGNTLTKMYIIHGNKKDIENLQFYCLKTHKTLTFDKLPKLQQTLIKEDFKKIYN